MSVSSISRWIEKQAPLPQVQRLQTDLGIGLVFATILTNRGITTREDALTFFHPKLETIHDPYLFNGMKDAVERIVRAIDCREKIFLYGDYDADGITGTSLLYRCLKLLNAQVDYYIPDRLKEGYGMNVEAISHLHQEGARLIITVDCGIRNNDAVTAARELGIDVVVTDHHEFGSELPEAVAILNPKDPRGHYPFAGIAGVGVAFKLGWALCLAFSPDMGNRVKPHLREFLMEAIGLVALGTVADVAPIRGENRAMVRYGLIQLESSTNVGIKALKEVSDLSGVKPLTPQHIGFRIGPRINAMGRLQHGKQCVELLITDDHEHATALARKLEQENRKRKDIQERILRHARQIVHEQELEKDKILVLAHENWHPGVIGIVASNLQSEFYRPVCMIALENSKGKGSARSIPGFHLCEALEHCGEYLMAYGGHALAAGFEIGKDKISPFRSAMNEHAASLLGTGPMQPILEIDAAVELNQINWELFYQIDKLSPFGEGNPYPLLSTYNAEVVNNPHPQRCGTKGEHLQFWVRQGSMTFRAIAFSRGSLCEKIQRSRYCDLVFSLAKNTWGGNSNLELEIKDIRVTE